MEDYRCSLYRNDSLIPDVIAFTHYLSLMLTNHHPALETILEHVTISTVDKMRTVYEQKFFSR